MNINEKDIIILNDDNRYMIVKKIFQNHKNFCLFPKNKYNCFMIVKKIEWDNINYYYLADIDNNKNLKFLYEDGNELVEIEDEDELENIIIKMSNMIDVDELLVDLKKILQEKFNR